MAHIVEFTVEGLAGRKEIYKKRLNRDINILYGLNGSGKTSLLRILDSAMDGDAARIKMVPFKTAEVVIYSEDWKGEFVRKIQKPDEMPELRGARAKGMRSYTVSDADTNERLSYEVALGMESFKWQTKPEPPDPSHPARWRHTYLPTWRVYEGSVAGLRTPLARPTQLEREYDWDVYFAERLENLWRGYSTRVLSDVRKIQEEGILSLLSAIVGERTTAKKQEGVNSAIVYERVSAFLKRQKSKIPLGTTSKFQAKYSKEPLFAIVMDDIDQIEQRIEAATASRYQLEELIHRMFSGNKNVEFLDTGIDVRVDTGENIRLASLSSGEKHALCIFIETLRAGFGTLLIDEPEISLHIDWQRDLVSYMHQLNPKAQLIAATHSPEIMANIPDSKIFEL